MSGYGALAPDYDGLTGDVDYQKMADYICLAAKQHCRTAQLSTLLDAGCGSGRLLEQLGNLFENCIGVDASADMLEIAMERCMKKPPLLLCQPLEQLDLYGTIEVAVSTLDTLNHITDPVALAEAIRRISLFLEPGGLFIFDVNTLYKHQHVLANNTFVDENEACFCVWENRWEMANHTTRIFMNLFDREEDDCYIRQTETVYERCWMPQELELMLDNAHLDILEICDDYSGKKPGKTTQRLTYLTRKRPTKSGGQVDEIPEG